MIRDDVSFSMSILANILRGVVVLSSAVGSALDIPLSRGSSSQRYSCEKKIKNDGRRDCGEVFVLY